MQACIRSAKQLKAARKANREDVSLVLGRAVEKVIRSKRAIVATKAKLERLRLNREKNPRIA